MFVNVLTVYLLVYSGVFICRGKEDALVTKNMVVGESVYGEKRISVEVKFEWQTGQVIPIIF